MHSKAVYMVKVTYNFQIKEWLLKSLQKVKHQEQSYQNIQIMHLCYDAFMKRC